ncbi:putative phloem protein [Rosa chinensis]|uniref:Putative phloem protein n=1 Tax=Rosa chinensis TaxID=74649 RepID=A0A2P6P411_ROSCH|nr:uncharacterized protein LOC112180986 isoform X3 [Rosa chinensis]PRQ16659.1 putative phloem protein [Rosa chinensis]
MPPDGANSTALNFVGGIPFQLLYDAVKIAIRKTSKFKIHLINLQTMLDDLQSAQWVIQRIGDYNLQLRLPNDVIENLQRKMNDGRELVNTVSKLSRWDIRIWGNCYNCIGDDYGEQLNELNSNIRRLFQLLELQQQRNVAELLELGRSANDKLDEIKDKLDRMESRDRRKSEMIAELMEKLPQHNGTNGVQQVALSNGGEGAAPALREVFQQLFTEVIRLEVKNLMFKSLFQRLESTLYCLQPLVEEISKSTRVLYIQRQEVENFISCIVKGVELLCECSKVCKRVTHRKNDYTDKIQNLDESLQTLFIELIQQVGRSLKEAMDSADSIEAAIKEIEGISGVVQKNDVVSNVKEGTLVDSERVIEEALKPIEGSDAVQDQMKTDQLPHEHPSPAVGLDVHTLKKTSDDVNEETLLDLARVKDEVIKPIDDGSDVLKNETECEIAAAEPPSSSPAVGSAFESTSNATGGLKRLKEKKHDETEIIMQVEFPYQCIENIISLTTPADACRLSSISWRFRGAAESDGTWENFLPPDIHRILSQSTSSSATSVDPGISKSKKEFYLDLCDNPVLIDNGKMSFSLDKWSGKKCYMICARALHVVWSGEKHTYWKWISVPDSRFEEVACLNSVCWLEIRGKIDMQMMSPSTLYKAYIVYKLTADAYGFRVPVEVATRSRDYGFEYKDLDRDGFIEYPDKRRGCLNPDIQIDGTLSPKERVDGWLEMELGEFLCQGKEVGELEMICVEMNDLCWKSGLIVQGIEVRPERKEYCEAKGKARSHLRDKGKKAMTTI